MIRAPRDHPPPAGFAPQDMTWPERRKLLGTYDKKWMDTRYPGFPADMQWSAMNLSPEDQQIEQFFRGDEAFWVDGMHPTGARVEGRLPGVSTRAFVVPKGTDEPTEVTTRLDTVWLLPHIKRGVLVFRGITRVAEDDAHDVGVVLAALERMGAARDVGHYREALEQRKDRKKAAILALSDKDLVPEGLANARGGPKPDDGLKSEGLRRKRMAALMRERYAEQRGKIVDELSKHNIDPAKANLPEVLPEPPEPSTDPEQVLAQADELRAMAEQMKAKAAAQQAEAEVKIREELAKHGQDYDKLVAENAAKAGGPPKLGGAEQVQAMRGKLAGQAERLPAGTSEQLDQVEQQLADSQARALDAYKKHAHHMPPARRLEGDEAARVRQEVIAARARGESLAGRDLTGADLSGLDLTGADLRGTMLESANLAGTQLGGAKLSGAVLARADLTKANLFAAKLDGANLGAATLVDAELGEADLTRATLAKANLTGARLRNVRLERANLMEAVVASADLSGVYAPGAKLLKLDLSGAKLAGADLTRSVFLECVLDGVDATGAKMTGCAFVKARGERVVLRGAALDGACFTSESSLPGADLTGASLQKTNLRGTVLTRANLSMARMDGADLSECDLEGATLERARAREARFDRANLTGANLRVIDLMGGSLSKARLQGADLRAANLFRTDLTRVRLDTATRVADANLLRARMLPAHKGA